MERLNWCTYLFSLQNASFIEEHLLNFFPYLFGDFFGSCTFLRRKVINFYSRGYLKLAADHLPFLLSHNMMTNMSLTIKTLKTSKEVKLENVFYLLFWEQLYQQLLVSSKMKMEHKIWNKPSTLLTINTETDQLIYLCSDKNISL
jgi:hypothetical protein